MNMAAGKAAVQVIALRTADPFRDVREILHQIVPATLATHRFAVLIDRHIESLNCAL